MTANIRFLCCQPKSGRKGEQLPDLNAMGLGSRGRLGLDCAGGSGGGTGKTPGTSEMRFLYQR